MQASTSTIRWKIDYLRHALYRTSMEMMLTVYGSIFQGRSLREGSSINRLRQKERKYAHELCRLEAELGRREQQGEEEVDDQWTETGLSQLVALID